MTYLTRFICLSLFSLLLTACGQSGPLTLPDQSSPPDASQDGEPVPDAIPQELPDPAEVPDDQDI